MQRTVSRILGSLIDVLLPPTCAACGREGRYICETCKSSLPPLKKPHCRLCASPGTSLTCSWCHAMPPAFDGVRAPYLMEGTAREIVYGLKYRNLRASAPELGRLMGAHLALEPVPADVLVPVPLHPRRERERGYNQSGLLAREVSKQSGIPMEPQLLRRIRNTRPQVSVEDHEERRRNMEGAFECAPEIGSLKVLLIDDVVTTGATMSACAGPLKAAGAASVWGLALARQR